MFKGLHIYFCDPFVVQHTCILNMSQDFNQMLSSNEYFILWILLQYIIRLFTSLFVCYCAFYRICFFSNTDVILLDITAIWICLVDILCFSLWFSIYYIMILFTDCISQAREPWIKNPDAVPFHRCYCFAVTLLDILHHLPLFSCYGHHVWDTRMSGH